MLLHDSPDSETRKLVSVGAALFLCIALISGALMIHNPFGGRSTNEIAISLEVPYVGQGVASGTHVVMHGVQIGTITAVTKMSSESVKLDAALEKQLAAELTDKLSIDFRPINYFGVTGVNITPGSGGLPLRDGAEVKTSPKGNFALQTLLTRLGSLSNSILTPQLVQVIDRATRYLDALDPLVETALISANAVALTQTVPTSQLLANAAGLSATFPPFADALTDAGMRLLQPMNGYNRGAWDETEDFFEKMTIGTLDTAVGGLFNSVGKLESSHYGDLVSLVEGVEALTSVVPPLIRPEGISEMLIELRTRLEHLYEGSPEQRALQVRIVLDVLPGIAAPLNNLGAP